MLTTKSISRPPNLEADEPLTPIEDRCVGAVSLDEFDGVRLDLVPAPRYQTISRTPALARIPERHRRAALGFYCRAYRAGGGQQDRGKDTLTRLATLGTLSRNAGEGLLDVQPQSPSPAPRERGGPSPQGLGG